MARSLILVVVLLALNSVGCAPQREPPQSRLSTSSESDRVLRDAFERHIRNLQVEGRGVVKAILPDDDKGSRHQRFILELKSGQTLLIAHNIDISTRITSLQDGDEVEFRGEYDWNPQGGVIHWTHRDPAGQHESGWLKHRGQTYR